VKPAIRLRTGAALALALAGLAGCAVGPEFHAPTLSDGIRYRADRGPGATSSAPVAVAGSVQRYVQGMDIPGQWWTLFRSPQLNAVVAHALANNPSLAAAHASLRAAREQAKASAGALWPSLSASFNPTRNKTSKALSPVPGNNAYLYNLHTAQLNVSYTPDLWGGIRRQVESDKAAADLRRFELEATYLTLTSNVVNAAIAYASVKAQIAATEEIIASQHKLLVSLQGQQGVGGAALKDVGSQQLALAQAQAGLPGLQQQLAAAHDQIAALCGDMPDAPTPDFDLAEFHLPDDLPVSLPSRLIEQRPDVKSAESTMHDYSALIGVAIANRLPNVQLTATPGIAVNQMSQFFTGGFGNWTLAAMMTQPLFQGFQLLHLERAARRNFENAAAQYRDTVIGAMQDTADSLHATETDADAVRLTAEQARAAAENLRITKAQLGLGDVSAVTLLTAQQVDAQARLALVQAEASRFSDTVGLFQSLGGGWWNRNDVGNDLK